LQSKNEPLNENSTQSEAIDLNNKGMNARMRIIGFEQSKEMKKNPE
jgi:hypothetical protein